MTRLVFNGLMTIILGAGLVTALHSSPGRAQNTNESRPDSYRWNNRTPDERYKADILLVVAHPDDEVMATAYLAREIYDNHKKVAVVYETPGMEVTTMWVRSKPRPWARFARSRRCAP
jgi:hypothetical protein